MKFQKEYNDADYRIDHMRSDYQNRQLNARIMVVVTLILALFLIFTLRLFDLQVIDHTKYKHKLQAFISKEQTLAPLRGTIYDNNEQVLATSKRVLNISYYPLEKISDTKEWELAKKFSEHFSIPEIKLDKVTKKKLLKEYNEAFPNRKVEKIDDTLMKTFIVKYLMNHGNGEELRPILKKCSQEEFAYLSEHQSEFPGFMPTYGWDRDYTNSHLNSLVGKVSSEYTGLPKEDSFYLQGLGYALNDRVGTSGIEKYYENYLKGDKARYEIKYDKNGKAYLKTKDSGKPGYDLHLTINQNYQQTMDNIISQIMISQKDNPYRKYWNSTYFVAVDIKTGGILAMNGVKWNKDRSELYYDPSSTYVDADRVGSSIKPATMYMGKKEKVVKDGDVVDDKPLHFLGTQPLKSFMNYNKIDDRQAIALSSNVYMWEIILRMGGLKYVDNVLLDLPNNLLDKMRHYYQQFGLGVKTGLDVDNEQVGNIGSSKEDIKMLYQAIGQYDTYTPMQLAQYVTTIANDGKRYKLHLLDKVSEVNDVNTILYQYKPELLNVLEDGEKYLKRSQEGMRDCSNNGHCAFMQDYRTNMELASKSGTAENELYIDGKEIKTTNNTMIAYGPYKDPKVAFICFTPNANNGFGSEMQINIAGEIVSLGADEYQKLFLTKK